MGREREGVRCCSREATFAFVCVRTELPEKFLSVE